MYQRSCFLLMLCGLLAWMSATASGQNARVGFYQDGDLVMVERPAKADASPVKSAIQALVAGPNKEEAKYGVASALPAGTKLVDVVEDGENVIIEFSHDVLKGLDEAALLAIYDQVRTTLIDSPQIASIQLTCKGNLLSSYLDQPAPIAGPFLEAQAMSEAGTMAVTAVGLAGKNITIGPSHGRFWNGSGWYWQRTDPCGFGEAVLEDTNSIRLMQFLYQYLTQDGATVHVPRELNESNCCHSATGLPWWKMASRYWLQANGLPASVWDSSTTDLNDDIRARPLFADYRGSNIYVSCHTNAGGGTGTETFRDTAMQYPAHEAASYNLALAINNNTINAIRELVDSSWANRGVKDSAGGFGEIRIPNRPACLIELAFHDHCTKDGVYLQDNFFRSAAEWGVYKGICEYFGNTPTWDRYSDEFVSSTIPATMQPGQSVNVSVTFRNRGVVWSDARSFRLGAVGDSDPFTSFNRVNISGEVRPGSTYTFNFTMTAPTTPGTYTSDWRMVRDGVTWFGPTHTNTITVDGGPSTFIVESRAGGQNNGNFSVVSTWANSTAKSTAAGCTAGIGSLYTSTSYAGRTATYSFTPGMTTTWNVYATWPTSSNGCPSATHLITHAGGTATVQMNQTTGGNAWNLLGSYTLNAGTTYTVVQTTDGSSTGSIFRADAVKWER